MARPNREFLCGGTNSSNPSPSTGESANHRFLSGAAHPGPQPGPSSTREGLRRANELAPDFPGFIGRGVDVDIPFAAFQLADLRVRQYRRALDRAG